MDNGASSYRRFRDEGDEDGLVQIIKEYRNGLIYYLFSIVGNIQIAEELAEDVFVILGTKKPKDHGKSSFKTWLYTIGRNHALNYLKKHKHQHSISFDDSILTDEMTLSLEEQLLKAEVSKHLHCAINQLKTEYRQVLWLIYFENFSNKEVAVVMKKSVHSVETLVYRARKSLKLQLEMEGFSYEDL